MTANVLHSSASSQWFTPPEIIAVVRGVLGRIDLDPCSCALANQIVGASVFMDGVTRGSGLVDLPWTADTAYQNFPYSKKDGGPVDTWIAKSCREFAAGNFGHGIMLLNATPGTAWFSKLWAFDVAFLRARIEFLEPTTQFLERLRVKKGWEPWAPGVMADPELVADLAARHGRIEEFPGLVRGPAPSHTSALVLQTHDRRVVERFNQALAAHADIVPAGTVRPMREP